MEFAFFVLVLKATKKVKIIIHYKGGSTMKTKLTVISLAAILVTACTTGTRLTKTYDDDIYFSPSDVPPVAVVTEQAESNAKANNNDTKGRKIIMSQVERNADGSATVNNYIYQEDKKDDADYLSYNMDNQSLVDSDTARYYNDDEVKTVINNYYDSDDLDYAYRIRRFHSPFFYSPFYDDWYYGYYSPWYSGYYGMNYGWGYGYYDPWYSSWGWGYPYYYGYYSPFAFGLGYWGLGGYYGGYYGGYWGGNYGGGYYANQRIAPRRDTNTLLPGGSRTSDGFSTFARTSGRPNSTIGSSSELKSATLVNDRRASTSSTGRRYNSSNTPGREISTQVQQNGASGATRRALEPSATSRTYEQTRATRQNYTPSYTKPRVVTQPNYNSGSTYSRQRSTETYDRSATRSSANNANNYSEPRSSSNMRQTYRSSSSYSSGASSSGYNRSSSDYSRPSSTTTPSYSSPSRGSSTPSGGSYSGGSTGGSYGGSSGGNSGSSGGGGGGSGHRR
jgi:hypothetical protein